MIIFLHPIDIKMRTSPYSQTIALLQKINNTIDKITEEYQC